MISKKISDTLPNNNEQENKLRRIALNKNLIYKKMTFWKYIFILWIQTLHCFAKKGFEAVWMMVINLHLAYSQIMFETGCSKSKAILKPK